MGFERKGRREARLPQEAGRKLIETIFKVQTALRPVRRDEAGAEQLPSAQALASARAPARAADERVKLAKLW
jgi:hypothetical protein